MSDVDILRCPCCGAVIKDKNAGKCEYCGAVWVHHERGQKLYGDEAEKLHEGEVYYFNRLPGVAITTKTRDVPFQPEILFNKLPGGVLDPTLKNDADAICSAVEKMQRGCNREDIDLYMSVVSQDNQEFYQKVKKGAIDQFITSDMKRYAVSIDFLSLSGDSALVDNTIEMIIFRSKDTTTQLEVTFRNTFNKQSGEWKIVNSEFRPPTINIGSLGLGKIPKWTWIIPLIGLMIGVIAAIIAIIASISPMFSDKLDKIFEQNSNRNTYQENPMPSNQQNYQQSPPNQTKGNWIVSKNALVIYLKPDLNLQPSYIIMPEAKYQILKKSGDWTHIRTEDGRTGWTLTTLIEK